MTTSHRSETPTSPRPVTYDHILVPLDGSKRAAVALRTGEVLASHFGAELHTISVASDPSERLVMCLDAAAIGVEPADHRVHGSEGIDAAAAIDALANELGSCLVCMSTHGRGRIAGTMLGSVARSVLQRRSSPVILIGPLADRQEYLDDLPPSPLSIPRVVACIDSSLGSDAERTATDTVALAADWASSLDMSLGILTVVAPSTDMSRAAQTESLQPRLAELAMLVADRAIGSVDIDVEFDPFDPAAGVRAHLSKHPAGLLVVSTHARSGFQRFAHGAVAADIIATSEGATLVVAVRHS